MPLFFHSVYAFVVSVATVPECSSIQYKYDWVGGRNERHRNLKKKKKID